MSESRPSRWHVLAVPAFEDNYLWVIHDGREAVLVDPGDAAAIEDCLDGLGLRLSAILCTHHHQDHVGGVDALVARHGPVPVYASTAQTVAHRTHAVADGQSLDLPPGRFEVIAVPGHTLDHVAYRWRDRLFCGDTLFALGCGRVFEGTPAQMHASLNRLAGLEGSPWVHCAHEYTLSNLAFALHVDPDNPVLQARAGRERARRAAGLATVPSRLDEERATNPFLRAQQPALQASAEAHAGRTLTDPVEVFTELRAWKNGFRG